MDRLTISRSVGWVNGQSNKCTDCSMAGRMDNGTDGRMD